MTDLHYLSAVDALAKFRSGEPAGAFRVAAAHEAAFSWQVRPGL
jgi:hypothetical protein